MCHKHSTAGPEQAQIMAKPWDVPRSYQNILGILQNDHFYT